MAPNGRLNGKVCIITGSGGGFGETIAKRFVLEGAKVVIAEINRTAGERVKQEIASTHKDQVLFVQSDVTSKQSWEELLEKTLEKFGILDIVFNNAGTTYRKKPSHEVTEKEWQMLIDVNMKSIYLSTAVILPYFIKQKAGHMLNTSSIGGYHVKEQLVYYGASKTFVNMITEGLASEYGPYGIRVNSICPLLGYTGLTEAFIGTKNDADFRKEFEATVPLRRGLDNNDLANAAIYLCSDEASFVTGVNLKIDGGSTCV
ncbi:putative alcohol dehydrogenase [Melanomma pulvis-pyrius CBS 109.77]|uniref:Putative alcohol dehydrogenase n=1 Tax=Melanomma pulvis-pyrius CBS 109.77 TaxID=1314802 RepID=A0A6A6X2L1_9PLEO|nr:putative alcohol dehydrogenase [Melanomma pulvis-pyrius CBS 109.77]